ncbi:DUF3592 domain-containing protein [Actinoplanes bogorensis]|uniref:DUF3592 domain-containing protein n=2 Tax=Paractinoplanes bogorensis TaxID=1610840 RepID=A0ABS5YMQ9_9ACTN|nr:DUF3592 domain-containing protein [Actinoplanes bogorensis]
MVLAVILVLIGAGVLYKGVREIMHLKKLRTEGRQAWGRVTGHQRREGGGRAVIVNWTDDYGATHEIVSTLSAGRPTFGIGEAVSVRYLAGDPRSATIDERRENVRSNILVVVIGFGFAAAGIALAVQEV